MSENITIKTDSTQAIINAQNRIDELEVKIQTMLDENLSEFAKDDWIRTQLVELFIKQKERIEELEAQKAELIAAINEIMPRYIELYEHAGLGDPSKSIAFQIAKQAIEKAEK